MYDSPSQFLPLLPQAGRAALLARAADISRASVVLTGKAHATTRKTLRELVRFMNSYYSNRIEGQSTSPRHIEQAMRQDFSQRPGVAKLQRLAVAHIEAERALERDVVDGRNPLLSEFVCASHAALYAGLPENERPLSKAGTPIEPGALRTEAVVVGDHVGPAAASIPRFFGAFDEAYGPRRGWDEHLVAVACAHHRMAWIHPFADGNGRAVRLQTHCALWSLNQGLWSVNRGLARRQTDYYARLANADASRRGDLDGRGNLTDAGLAEWVEFFLDVCEDQVSFMQHMLDLDEMKRRIEALVTYRSTDKHSPLRKEAVLPLFHTFTSGPLTRGEFAQMAGLGARTARALLAVLLKARLLVSDTPYGPVRFGMPLDALNFLFPRLYPEAGENP